MRAITIVWIFVGWIVVGVTFGWSILYKNPPLAGASFFILTSSFTIAVVAPIINSLIAWRQIKHGRFQPIKSVALTLVSIFVMLFLLLASGIFNFT